MLYNQTRTSCGTVMPLLMGCTKPQPIEALQQEEPIVYDPVKQTVIYDMRTVGTRSLKTSNTRIKVGSGYSVKADRKNEIDDSKNVK